MSLAVAARRIGQIVGGRPTLHHVTATIDYPGARPPDRASSIDANGVRLALHEWGDADAPPLILAHGGFDFARTFDLFAPHFADAGWRVVSWDHRGHGDSEHTHLYSWDADLRDAAAVFDHVGGRRPLPAVGHSKGGALTLNLADAQPFRFRRLVNIDGMPSRRPVPDVAEHERTKLLAGEITAWLDHRARTASAQRKPGTIDELAERRGRMNPRLEHAWLRYLVTVGAFESDDGWRWKIDASMRFGGFGPWRPEWALMRMAGIGVPFYGMLVEHSEPMGWGTTIEDIVPYAPDGGLIEELPGVGHFAHIEQPGDTAGRIMEFLGAPA
jgi:pimeloyl-ACP methyl ester carboxylesterase